MSKAHSVDAAHSFEFVLSTTVHDMLGCISDFPGEYLGRTPPGTPEWTDMFLCFPEPLTSVFCIGEYVTRSVKQLKKCSLSDRTFPNLMSKQGRIAQAQVKHNSSARQSHPLCLFCLTSARALLRSSADARANLCWNEQMSENLS